MSNYNGRREKYMNTMRIIILTVVLTLGTFCTVAFTADNDTATAAPAVVIDVRTEAEWKEGHLEGAVLIPYDQIEAGIKTVVSDKKTKIYLYCRSGRRTGIAYDVLSKEGYRDLVNLGTVENASKTLNRAIVK
jgi:phage shock protein E